MDAAKAIAALATNSGEPLDYLEVVGRGLAFQNDPAPVIAAPTTAGTGSEVTRNAVLGVPTVSRRVSDSPKMLPRIAVIDPELTFEVASRDHGEHRPRRVDPTDRAVRLIASQCHDRPVLPGRSAAGREVAAASLSQTARISKRGPTWPTRACSVDWRLANAGWVLFTDLLRRSADMFDAPHGAVCAALLPHGMRANVDALWSALPVIRRWSATRRLLRYSRGAIVPKMAIEWVVRTLRLSFAFPPLRSYGIGEKHVEDAIGRRLPRQAA